MTEADKTKRAFFKKAATAVGFVAAANYLGKLVVAQSSPSRAIGDRDRNKQKDAWLQKQFVLMTDNEKKQMLDEILDSHNRTRA